MLNIFQRQGIVDFCCVVTRYFGGILLGAGGLSRAYAKAAKDVLNAAGVARIELWTQWELDCPYGMLDRIRREAELRSGRVISVDYGADVRLKLAFPPGKAENFAAKLRELSAGGLDLRAAGELTVPIPYS